MYRDDEFPADDTSVGATTHELDVYWRRGSAFNQSGLKNTMHLFADGSEPADCIQGQLGDCWLLSAFACLAEDSREIEGLFVDREFNPRGRYSVRIYDAIHKKNVIITVDDRIPCDRTSGRPCFTTPNGDELWVMLLEKAFAKVRDERGDERGFE